MKISIEFTRFSLEDSHDCKFDNIQVSVAF